MVKKGSIWVLAIFIVLVGICLGISIYSPNPPERSEDKKSIEVQKNQEKVQKTQIESDADNIINKISYMRDKRTGLCFAYIRIGYGISITEVLCNKVRDLLPDNQK